MTTHKVSSPARRFTLPALCTGLAVASAVWGETVLREHAGQPEVGPLLADQIAVMVAIAFGLLAVITTLMAVFPGREASPTSDEDAEAEVLIEQEIEEELDGGDEEGRSTDAIVGALKKSAAKQSHARIAAEKRADAAEARVEELEALLATFRAGTAPEMKALDAKYREEANRDALRKVQEVGEAAERLAHALKEAKSRAEQDLAEAKSKADSDLAAAQSKADSDLAAAQENAAQELARVRAEAETAVSEKDAEVRDLEARLPQERHEAAVEAHRRIQIALAAINDTHVDVLDHLQRDAVRAHADRITAALDRLAPDAVAEFGPDLALPPLEAASEPETERPQTPAPEKKRGGLFRRQRG